MTPDYVCVEEVPEVADYCRLRRVAGLKPRSEVAAAAGLPNTIVGAVVRHGDAVVGMGRVIGDGLFYKVVDIAVQPDHQGRGLGKAIMATLMARVRAIAPAEAQVSLLADGDAKFLYAQFGFAPSAPESIGMTMWVGA
jgi:GNAT superfamily N-acetyltransferase